MPVIEHKITINRSVAEIFRFMADFSNNPKWQPDSIQLERSGKVKVGDMVVGMQRVTGRMQHVNADVVDYVPNQKLAFTGIMGTYPFRTTYTYDFSGAGGTQVGITTDIRVPWIYIMFRPFVVSGLNGQIEKSLANLKEYLEARRDLGT